MSLWSRLRNSLNPRPLDEEIDAEVQTHLEALREAGVDERLFGNSLTYRETSREIRIVPWLESVRADVVFSLRQIRRSKTVTAAVALSLALGIGATTSALRLVDAGFLRPLAIRAPENLYFLRYTVPGTDARHLERDSFSYAEFLAMKEALKNDAELLMASFADRRDVTYAAVEDVERVTRQFVSGSLFEDFGLSPSAGRLFSSMEDSRAADHNVAVISHDYWQRRFASDPSVIGKRFRCDGQTYSIIGVADASFTGTSPGAFTDIFLPLLASPSTVNTPQAVFWNFARVLVHLKPATSADTAQQRVRAIFARHRTEAAKQAPPGTPERWLDAYRNAKLTLLSGARGVSNFHRDYWLPVAILTAAAVLVLMLCCVSAANLMVAQGAARAREMALRISIGAGRGRLIRLLLIESLMLGAPSAVLGILFSAWATPLMMSRLNTPDNPLRLNLQMDARILLIGVALTFAVTLLFGLLPAFHTSSIKPVEALKTGWDMRRQLRLMRVLVSAQVAFCFLVCLVAGLLVASLQRMERVPLGFAAEGLLLVELQGGPKPPQPEVWRDLARRAATLPGVQQASFSAWPVQTGSSNAIDVQVAGAPNTVRGTYMLPVSSGWFETMRIPIVEGRDFRPDEPFGALIVNEHFARQHFPNRSPIGERVSSQGQSWRVVGVSGDVRLRDVAEAVRPTVYLPLVYMQQAALTLRLAPEVPPATLTRAARQLVARQFPQLQVSDVRPQMGLIQMQTVRERMLAALATFFGLIALIMSGTGLYALLSFSATQHKRDIAIRMALGASTFNAVGSILSESARALGMGIAVGFVVGLSAHSLIRSFLFEVTGSDPGVLGATTLAIILSAALASAAPAIRTARINPAAGLRTE